LELKNLYDSENVKVFASSSSSSLLNDKRALLTGRANVIEVLPLDFNEFLLFNKISVKPSESYLLEKYFEDYMLIGGIPEYVLTKDVSYFDNLIDSVIYKDIAFYHGVRDVKSLKNFFRLLMERAGKQLSLNKISKILGVSVETLKRYFEYFQNTYLIYTIERCGKLNERLRAPKKIYAADLGIRNYITGFRDKGALFENLVYLKIKNNNPCYVYKNATEIDFFFNDNLIEVKYGREMEMKQKKLFDNFPAKKKSVIDDIYSYLAL
jgi:predicted AAA+ superfamily ATPase